jgi:hypothetical protein
VARWGDLVIPAAVVPGGGWHHVVVTLQGGRPTCHVDGRAVAWPAVPTRNASGASRLTIGAQWDGRAWSGHLDGAIAQVRVHSGVLSAAQIAANHRRTGPNRAAAPAPADDALVESPHALALSWSVGAHADAADVYLGQDRAAVSAAERTTTGIYQGRHRPGEFRPTLVPGQEYVWRVDHLDDAGQPVARGTCWSFRIANGLVVDLRPEDLPTGTFTAWRNRGTAGGGFVPGSTTALRQPHAGRKDGRAAVDFDGERCLVSSVPVPASLRQGFTVAAWVLADELPGGARDRSNTWLSFGRRNLGGTEFLWNWQPDSGLFMHGGKKQRVDIGYRSGIADAKGAREAMPLR